LVVPVAILAWYYAGPAKSGWAKRSGTPTSILATKTVVTTSRVVTKTTPEPTSFTSGVTGAVNQGQTSNGLALVNITLSLKGGPGGAAKIALEGFPRDEGGVEMTASGVSFVPATTRSVYSGNITGLQGTEISATVTGPHGHSLSLDFALSIDPNSGNVSGTVSST
jgi:hypothetical protein